MIIALVGTPSAGKHTVLDYLVTKHGFERVVVAGESDPEGLEGSVAALSVDVSLALSSSRPVPGPPSPWLTPARPVSDGRRPARLRDAQLAQQLRDDRPADVGRHRAVPQTPILPSRRGGWTAARALSS